jgi:hypothetical protein
MGPASWSACPGLLPNRPSALDRCRVAKKLREGRHRVTACCPQVLADAKPEADCLQTRCDFLTGVNEPSRPGRFGDGPVKVLGTWRASRPDALGLAYRGFVLGEVLGRRPPSGPLILPGDRTS